MPFPPNIRLEALIACQRHGCLCHERKHTRIQCHHIIQEADGRPNTPDNCIPLCPDCHSEVLAYNPRHPVGATPYSPDELKRRRDDWYANLNKCAIESATRLNSSPSKYPHSKATEGRVTFNYSQYDGFYRLGEGNHEFLTCWSKASDTQIHCYSDDTNVSVALAPKGAQFQGVHEASLLHFGSRVQTAEIGRIVVLENHCGRYAGIQIVKIQDDKRGHPEDLLVFDYHILEDGAEDFSP